jgi:hypothetical protein
VRFKDYSVVQVLVGLDRIGIVGLSEAFQNAEDSGLQDREAILDVMIEHLSKRNYMPETRIEAYRKAIWREYLRRRGEDFSDFFLEIEVIIRGEVGEARDRFLELITSVLADFALRPVIVEYAPVSTESPNPQLEIGGETIARGITNRSALKKAVHQSLSDW